MGFDKIAERIYQYNEVNAVYLMSGSFDFTVFIEGKTMQPVAQFVSDQISSDGVCIKYSNPLCTEKI